MKDARSTNNCYMWSHSTCNELKSYRISKIKENKLWHMKLDHLILRSKRKIIDDNLASVLIVIEVIKIYVCVCKDYAILTKQSNVC